MDDSIAPVGSSEKAPDVEVPKDLQAHADLGPCFALLQAEYGNQIPTAALGADSVPQHVLAAPAEIAKDLLVAHLKKCRISNCKHIPPSLWFLKRWRPDAIRREGAQITRALWTHGDHELVEKVRERVLHQFRAHTADIRGGALSSGEKLGGVLARLGDDSLINLAAVLWACKFDVPNSESIFRALVPLISGPATPAAERISLPGRADQAHELASTKSKLRALRHDLDVANEKAKQAARAARPIDSLNRQLAAVQETISELRADRDRLSGIEDRQADIARKLTKDLTTASTVNNELRRDLKASQREASSLGVELSAMAARAAAESGRNRRLTYERDRLPSGTDAMWQFLCLEEERIATERMISSGGDRARADQKWNMHNKLKSAFLAAYPSYVAPRPVTISEKSKLRLVALGGSAEVGRSCYLLELGDHRILVDCGIKPGATEDMLPGIDQIQNVDALILTHAHTDHVGWVPALIRRFGEIDIYCSPATAALLPAVLADCHRHYVRKTAIANDQARHIKNRQVVEPAYDEAELRLIQTLAVTCEFDCEEPLPFGGVSITFFRAGHILGGASVLVRDETGRRILFSGDFSSFDQLTVPAARLPADLGAVDLLVLESTYGGKTHPSFVDSRADLVAYLKDIIENKHGSVILASFALGRAQELLSIIMSARESGQISKSVPVYIDGMIRQINRIYEQHTRFRLPETGFLEVAGGAERKEVIFAAQSNPAIIVTTSGMMSGGPVIEYARHLLPDARNRIVFTGYQDEGAPSRSLLDLVNWTGPCSIGIVDEGGAPMQIKASAPAKHVVLSSHADQPGLVDFSRKVRPRAIALVHGEPAAQEALREKLERAHPGAAIHCGPSELSVP